MNTRQLRNVRDVASWRLCSGCGACVTVCAEHAITFIDVIDQGIRPIVDESKCKKCGECIKVCPGIGVFHHVFNSQTIPELRQAWGPALEVWEGYATDREIRFRGSSGGVTTALSLFCLEAKQASGVLHIGAKPKAPLVNIPVFSKAREELLACTGSRYSPAAPCEKFEWIERAQSKSVFIGKPCDIVALRKKQKINPVLNNKVALAISIFCMGTPTTNGTYKLINALGIKPEQVEELRYRGHGWPGMTFAKLKGGKGKMRQISYEESWGNILSHYGQFRCRLCPDSTGEFADISCGDPWYREIKSGEPGHSLVLVRTERGREILHKALEAGYVELERVKPAILPASQKALLKKRRMLFGRLLAMHMMFIPTPCFAGFSLFSNWWQLSWSDKLRSILGTIHRIVTRRWLIPKPISVDVLKHTIDSAKSEIMNDSFNEKS